MTVAAGISLVPPRQPPASTPSEPVAIAPPAWTEVARPFVAYDLAGGPFAKLPLQYAARRNHDSGARDDTLTYGTLAPDTPLLRLSFYRLEAEPQPPASLFVDAARLGAGAGLAVTRSGPAERVATRFGPFDVAEVGLDRDDGRQFCLAFRLDNPEASAVLRLTGLACGSATQPLDRASLACTLDRIDLVSAGDDEALRALFVAAERRRQNACTTRSATVLDPPAGLRGPL